MNAFYLLIAGIALLKQIYAFNENTSILKTYQLYSETKDFHCPLNYFKCLNSTQCILTVELCDGILHCLDGSDEQHFCESDMCSSSSCRYGCHPSPSGPLCYCPEGSIYNGTHCLDIKIPSSFLLYTTIKPFAIKGVEVPTKDSHPSEIILPIYTSGEVAAVSYDPATNSIFYCDNTDQTIYQQNLKSSRKEAFLEEISNCSGLAVEPNGRNIYWSDANLGTIAVASLHNSSVHKILIQTSGAQPRNIVIDFSGYMFWIDRNMIKWAALDGGDEAILVYADIDFNSFVLHNHNIYWFNSTMRRIESININRIKQKVVIDDLPSHITSIAIFNKYFLWTDISYGWTKGLLYVKNLENMTEQFSILLENSPIRVIYVHSSHNIVSHNSSIYCDDCDLCLPMPYSEKLNFKCVCQEGFHFDNESKSCKVSLQIECGEHDYKCADGTCIPWMFVCDGQKDCINDEFEEKDCGTLCLYPSHNCDNGTKCITREKVCDRKYDCNDKSDEIERCLNIVTESSEKCRHQHSCEGECYDTPSGPVCGCPGGKYLSPDNSCVDTPPCRQWGRCSQICHSFNTSYACDCVWGYRLSEDKFTCVSKDQSEVSLLLTTGTEILRYFIHNNSQITLLSSKSYIPSHDTWIYQVDFYHSSVADILFWVDVRKRKIFRGILRGSVLENIHVIIEDGLDMVEDLCVDWIGHNLYWIDSKYHHIEVSKFDGSLRTSLLSGITHPQSIAIDPHIGFLFWTDISNGGSKIERSLANGDQRQVIVDQRQLDHIGWPKGITLDYATQYIYWVDVKIHAIYASDYHGNNVRKIFQKENHFIYYSMALHENFIYWTEREHHVLTKVDRWKKSTNLKVLAVIYPSLYDIRVFHSSHQPPVKTNPCKYNGHCSHLCLLGNNLTSQCACSYGWKLNKDGRTCNKYNKSLIFVTQEKDSHQIIFFAQRHNINSYIYTPIKIKLEYTSNIVYDERSEQFFWANINAIKTMYRNGKQTKTILQLAHMEVIFLATDKNSDNLYILTTSLEVEGESFLSVCTKMGGHFTILLNLRNRTPISLSVDSVNRLLFWVEIVRENNRSSLYYIWSALLDGSREKKIFKFIDDSNDDDNKPIMLHLQSTNRQICFVIMDNLTCISYNGRMAKIVPNIMPSYLISDHNSILYTKNGNLFEVTNGYEVPSVIGDLNATIAYMDVTDFNVIKDKYIPVSELCKSITVPLHNQISCIPKDAEDAFLAYINDGVLKGISLLKNHSHSLFPVKLFTASSNDDFDVSIVNDTVYWTDNKLKGIFSIKRDGTEKHRIITVESEISQLSVDWITGYIYWTSIDDVCIWVTDSSGEYKYVVIQGNLQHPSAIAVDPIHGYLFWSDSGSQSRIERSLLSGAHRKLIISMKMLHVSSIFIDIEESKMYWTDGVAGIVERSNLDGINREVLLSQKGGLISSPVSVATGQDFIYIADMSYKGGAVLQVRKDNISNITILEQDIGRSIGKLKLIDQKLQQKGTNICANNQICDQLCFYEGGSKYSCACSFSKLGKDQSSCLEHKQMMLMADKTIIMTLSLDDPASLNLPVPSITVGHDIKDLAALSYNRYQERIYFSDPEESPYLFSVRLDGSDFQPLLKDDVVRCIEGLAFDQVHGELYWTDSITRSVSRLRVEQHGEIQRQPAEVENLVMLDSQDRPRGITLDSCNLYVFWTNWREDSPRIERSYFSGAQREMIVTDNIVRPNGLVIDLSTESLFWADANPDDSYIIWNCDIDGSRRKIVTEGVGHHPFDLVVHGSFLYWTDWKTRSLLQTEKITGKGPAIIRSSLQKPTGLVVESPTLLKCQSVITEAGSRTSLLLDDCHNYCYNGGTCIPHTQNGQQLCLCPENFTGPYCEKHITTPRTDSISKKVPSSDHLFAIIITVIVGLVLVLLVLFILLFYRRIKCVSAGQNIQPRFNLPFIKRYTHPHIGDGAVNMTRESSFCNGIYDEECHSISPLFESSNYSKVPLKFLKAAIVHKNMTYVNEIDT